MNETAVSDLLSDHYAVLVLNWGSPSHTRPAQQLHQDIMSSDLTNASKTSLDDLIQSYESVMRELLGEHALLKTHVFSSKKKVPWYTEVQSAYRPCHSVDTALLRIHNDVLRVMDSQQGVFLFCSTSQRHSTLSTMTSC